MNAADRPEQRVEARVHRSIADIPQAAWDACFPGDPEGWAYYRAIERAGLAGFDWRYLALYEDGRLLAVAPVFLTEYRLDTTIQGTLKTLLAPLVFLAGRWLVLRLAGLGSPQADRCHLGFAPGVPQARRAALTARLLAALEDCAAGLGIGLLAAKDLAESDLGDGVGEAFRRAGFARQPGLPNARLALSGDEAAWLARLSPGARREVRRKTRPAPGLRAELCGGAAALALVPQIAELYEAQRRRSAVDFDQFEALTPAYFREVLAGLPDTAFVVAWYAGDELIGFNLCLASEALFIDKFIGLRMPQARAYDLYVRSWMHNLRHCLAHSIPVLQTGQTGYAMKLRLGSRLEPNWILFRHRNRVLDFLLKLAGPLLAADRHDPDLAAHLRAPRNAT